MTVPKLFFAFSLFVSMSFSAQVRKRPAPKPVASAKNDELANNAFLAMKKLQSTVESGVNKHDYSVALADANFPVKLYVESENSEKFADFTATLQNALKWYRAARELWERATVTDYPIGYCTKWKTPIPNRGRVVLGDELHMSEDLCSAYPELVVIEPDPRHYDATDRTVVEERPVIHFNEAQEKAWQLGGVSLKEAALAIR